MNPADEKAGKSGSGRKSFVKSGDVLESTVEDEKVLLDMDSESYYGLNRVGAHLWEELTEPRTVEELVESTVAVFDVSRGECRDDVESFLRDLFEIGLVKRT